MSIPKPNPLAAQLRNLYRSNETAKRLFDNFSNRKKDMTATPVARIAVLADTSYGDALALVKALANLKVGEFIAGRHGAKSRMVWKYGQKSLAEMARGELETPEAIADISAENIEDDEISSEAIEVLTQDSAEHAFQIRPGLFVKIKLPNNITKKEAERLAGFISQVPFDE